MAANLLKVKQSFVLGAILTISVIIGCSGYPAMEKQDAETEPQPSSDTDIVNEIHQRLKLGDRQAWDEMGPAVVDAVNFLMEQGIARSPVHALLILFWPESTRREHEQLLARVEPMVRNSYEDYFSAAAAANSTPESEPESESEIEFGPDSLSESETTSESESPFESELQPRSEPNRESESEHNQQRLNVRFKRAALSFRDSENEDELKNRQNFFNEVGARQYWASFGDRGIVQ